MRDSQSARNVSSRSRLVCSFVSFCLSTKEETTCCLPHNRRSLVSNELLFVFLQGGPCGVLASVQGFVLKHLLFGVNKDDVKKYVEVCSLCAELKSLCQPQAFAFVCYCLLT